VKAIFVLALPAVLGFATAGCSATKKIDMQVRNMPIPSRVVEVTSLDGRTITVFGSGATISNVKADTRIKCKGWVGEGVKIPRRGSAANVGQASNAGQISAVHGPSSSLEMKLTHLWNGSVRVVCTPAG
jgi:hypothetical protein